MFLILSLLFGCEKFEPERIIKVETGSVTNVSYTSCTVQGRILDKDEKGIDQHGFCFSTQQKPTTENNKTQLGLKSSTGYFSGVLTGLSAGTSYYVRAYATNSVGTAYGNEVSFTTDISAGTVTDYDGNTYYTVKIGDQVWMAENLKVTHYHDGTPIQLVEDKSAWQELAYTKDKIYCYYDNSSANGDTYGALYTWETAMNGAGSSDTNPSGVQGVCPDGLHLPSDDEWKELEMYLGMSQESADWLGIRGTDEGSKLKEAGTAHWTSPNAGATNEVGFLALPGGSCSNGVYSGIGDIAGFWSSTESSSIYAWTRRLAYAWSKVERNESGRKFYGYSVRCVRDD
ncbi:MAG: hypothetical protein KAX05_14195 [Bacteroidales bacterium]|nr:hypothetical protein [Bacteroidales bacterium]